MREKQLRFGLTGGIGSGKSYVAHQLQTLFNLPVYDCDSAAQHLLNSHIELQQQLKNLISPDVFTSDGTVNKKMLAQYLFSDESHAAQVNSIVHPYVFTDFEAWCAQQQGNIVVESAILIESGMDQLVDTIILVTAPLELRQQRVMQRDGLTPEQFQQRLAQQLTEDERIARAQHAPSHFIIHNDGRPLLPQLQKTITYNL